MRTNFWLPVGNGKNTAMDFTERLDTKQSQTKQTITNYVNKMNWKWAGHVARMADMRQTIRITQ